MEPKRTIKFMFDYNCAPLWLGGDECGCWLVSSDGYFIDDCYTVDGRPHFSKIPEERLKGEIELEQKVRFIYDVHNRLFDINEFPDGEPYLGFANEREKEDFYKACECVINRMSEIFGDEFTVHDTDLRVIKERLFD